MSGAAAAAPADHPESDAKAVKCRVFRHGKPTSAPADFGQISEILVEKGALVWFDAVDPGPHDLALLQEEFNLHPLAIEDAVMAHERPKIEAFESYWFLVVQGTSLQPEEIDFHEIAIFAGEQFLVTVRHSPAFPVDEIEQRWHEHPEKLHGGGFLLYTILDTIVDGYFPVAERFEEQVDQMEETLFRGRGVERDVLPKIFEMKKQAQHFRWAALPMRDILNPIIRRDLSLFPEEETIYYRDIYDHAVRVIDQLDSLRDLLNSALEIHLSVVANRQNEVAKQLTMIATIFLPLSFIVGFFGQNFSFLVGHIIGPGAFWLLGIGVEAFAIALTILYFKRKGWF